MNDYQVLRIYFEKILMLINIIEWRTNQLQKKITSSGAQCDYDCFLKILNDVKNRNKYLKEKLAAFAFQLTEDDEKITEILDAVYLNQRKLGAIYDGLIYSQSIGEHLN